MANGTGAIQIPVFGHISVRPADPATEWPLVAETPGAFTPRAGEVYRFAFMGVPDVRDPDLARVVDALAGAQAHAVKDLELSGCSFTTRGVRRLADLPWLESLSIYATDDELKTVARLTELRQLRLDSSDVTARGLASLAALKKLNDLSLHGCERVTDAGIEHLAELPALAAVTLDGCRALTDRAVRALASVPTLHALGLIGCWRLTDRALADLARMPQLTYLGLCRSSGFLVRLFRTFGLPGDPEVGSFSAGAVERLLEAHPDCNFFQPIDWAAVAR